MRQPGDCFVYFLRRADGEGPVKIGCSQEPMTRLSTMMGWSPYPLALLATVRGDEDLERQFHAMFSAQRSHGEWFFPSPELDVALVQLRAGTFDFSTLPKGKRLTMPRGPWSQHTRERFEAHRELERLENSGITFPKGRYYLAYDYWRLLPDEARARVVEVQQFIAAVREPSSRDEVAA